MAEPEHIKPILARALKQLVGFRELIQLDQREKIDEENNDEEMVEERLRMGGKSF